MKSRRAIVLAGLILVSIPFAQAGAPRIGRPTSNPTYQAVGAGGPSDPSESDAAEERAGSGPGPIAPYPVPPGALAHGIRAAQQVRQDLRPGWSELGPRGLVNGGNLDPNSGASLAVSGRLTAIAADPSTCSGDVCRTIYVGTAGGGVWKTIDAGVHWTPLLDDQPNLSVGAIALDPVNPSIVYAGTGDPSHHAGSHHGIGVLRSTDGGQTWEVLGSDVFVDAAISALHIDPRTAGGTNDTIYAATTRAIAGSSTTYDGSSRLLQVEPRLGLYISHDGGETWTLSGPHVPSEFGVDSVVMDPRNPTVFWAGFDGDGVYETTNGGRSWVSRNKGLPNSYAFTFLKVAMAPSDPNVLYAGYDFYGNSGEQEELYRTVNGGASWTKIKNVPNACDGQCFANLILAVDPTNPKIVYNGGTANYLQLEGYSDNCSPDEALTPDCNATLMKTTNSGSSWNDIAENGTAGPVHPDAHAIFVDPKNPSVLYFGTDGGLYHTTDGGRTWEALNLGLGTPQAQTLAVDSNANLYVGTQDNGALRHDGVHGIWSPLRVGDGGVVAVDPKNPLLLYSAAYGAYLYRNDDAGAAHHWSYISAFHGDFDTLYRGDFYEPYALAPTETSDIFFGTYRVWRSRTGGGTDHSGDGITFDSDLDKEDWVPISFDLSCGKKPKKPSGMCDSGNNNGQGISALAVSPVNPNVVVAGSANGHLWMTANALARVKTDASCLPWKYQHDIARCNYVSGPKWTRIDSGLPRRPATSIAFEPGSSSAFLVSYSGYDENTRATPGHIFSTADSGHTWVNLTGTAPASSLPDLPFTDVLVNPQSDHIYAAAEFGLYVSSDNGATWSRFDSGLPAVPVYQMVLQPTNVRIDVATYGRGVWEATAP